MMKTSKIFLHKWLADSTEGYIDIPWPQVHKVVGDDIINWVRSKDPIDVQLILEKAPNGYQRLYADFYNLAVRNEFTLLFAK
jgi:hypothetical protein